VIPNYAMVNARLNHCLGFDIIPCCALFESNHDLMREQMFLILVTKLYNL